MEDANNSRETITKSAKGEGKFIRRQGNQGQYGHLIVDLLPNKRGGGNEVTSEGIAGAIPSEFVLSAIDGIREALKDGVVAGLPVVDVVVHVVDGSYNEIDSSREAFKIAAIYAFRDAMKKAEPIILK